MVMEILFWFSIFAILYSVVIYPILLSLRNGLLYTKDVNYEPMVSFIISAYNEEDIIEKKLNNTLALKYPKHKLQIIVANDGSCDRTSEIVSEYGQSVVLLNMDHNGKTVAQNESIKYSSGDILIFSDANSMYKENALKMLVSNLSDDRIGCVCGELIYNNNKTVEGSYWSLEKLIKRLEGKSGRLLGVNGSIYAIKKELYQRLESDAISDFIEPILIYSKGYYIVYEDGAVAFEDEPKDVLNRKTRIILRSLGSLKYIIHLLNPFHQNNVALTLVSHKLIRWVYPIFFIIIFIASLILFNTGGIYRGAAIAQLIFYFLSLFFKPIQYFILVNFATLKAIVYWIIGKKFNTWKVVR